MSLSINTNLFSLVAQQNLESNQNPLLHAMEQLSSGLQINNASDNAAGLAIATRMQRQINGLNVALNNANQGISFAQTADGSQTQMINDLQRIYELANQSASYNTSQDRGSMNKEVSQLIAELGRVASQTEYNGQTFLNENFTATFQVGTEVGNTITMTTANVAPNAFGVQSSVTDFSNSSTNLANIAKASGYAFFASVGLAASATLANTSLGAVMAHSAIINNSLNVINRINQYTGETNITAFSFGNADVGTVSVISSAVSTIKVGAGYLTINGITTGAFQIACGLSAQNVVADLASSINAISTQTGVKAEVLYSTQAFGVLGASAYSIALVNTTGAAITVSVNNNQVISTSGIAGAAWGTHGLADVFGTSGNSIAAGQNGQIVFSSPLNTSATVGTNNVLTGNLLGVASSTVSMTNSVSINDVNVTTVGGANLAILAVEQGLNTMNDQQSYLGAIVNRLNSAVASISNEQTNVTAARGQIMDADYAVSTANLTKALITQQAGISVLAQANTIPNYVLALLPKA